MRLSKQNYGRRHRILSLQRPWKLLLQAFNADLVIIQDSDARLRYTRQTVSVVLYLIVPSLWKSHRTLSRLWGQSSKSTREGFESRDLLQGSGLVSAEPLSIASSIDRKLVVVSGFFCLFSKCRNCASSIPRSTPWPWNLCRMRPSDEYEAQCLGYRSFRRRIWGIGGTGSSDGLFAISEVLSHSA